MTILSISAIATVAQNASSKESGEFVVHGTVLDPAGKPVASASVQLEQKGGPRVVTSTNPEGGFEFPALRAGNYLICAEKSGRRSRIAAVSLSEQNSLEDIHLTLEVSDQKHSNSAGSPSGDAMAFADKPDFTVAGITDWTAVGGHGSDASLRTSEALARETATLKPDSGSSAKGAPSAGASNADLHRLVGDQDEAHGDVLAAVREYEQAVRLDPSEENYFKWGSELLLHRAVWPAVEVFRKGIEAYPKSARMLAALGAGLFASDRYVEAALRLCDASDLNPADPDPYIFLGKIALAAPVSLSCVEPKLLRFLQKQPENANANYYYAMTIWKRQKATENPQEMREVEIRLEEAVKINPKFGDAYLQLGNLSFTQHDLARAIDLYSKAIEVDPQLGDAHYRLGLAYQRTGQPAKAKNEFQLHDEIEKRQAADIERQRREVKQFLVILKNQPVSSSSVR